MIDFSKVSWPYRLFPALGDTNVLDPAGFLRCPARYTVDFKTIDTDGFEFRKADISPFGHFIVAIQDGESKKQVSPVVLSHVPVAPADEEIEVDHFFLCRDMLSLIQPGYPVKLLSGGRVPHGCFLSVRVLLFF